MTTLINEILIDAPIDKIWESLSNIEELDKYDPTVKESKAVSTLSNGIGAQRKVSMKDGKNWFEEKCVEHVPNKALTFELTACSFPVHNLKHSYSFEYIGGKTKVKQEMTYAMKHGILGNLMDFILVKRQSNNGIKLFLSGLKTYNEQGYGIQ